MKKVLTTVIFAISLIFLVSCPDQHPILRMTEPVGGAAVKTTDASKELVIPNVVLELLNDSFNETAVKMNADIAGWFVPSDKNKLEIKSAIVTDIASDASNTKSDSDIGKKTKVTLTLTVTPKKPTGKVPVNIAVQIPKAYSFDDERWTASNKRISVLKTDIAITISGEEEKEDDLVDIQLTPSTAEPFEFKKGSAIPAGTTIDFTLTGATWKASIDKNAFSPALPKGADITASINAKKTKLTLTFTGTPTADATSDALSYTFDAKSLISYDKKVNKIPDSGLKGSVRIKITDKDVKPFVQFAYGKANNTTQDKTYFTFYNPKEIYKDNVFSVTLTGGTWKDDILTAKYENATSAILPSLSLPTGVVENRTLSDDKTTLTITFTGTPTVTTTRTIYRIPVTNCVTPSKDYDVPENKYIAFTILVDKTKEITYKYTSSYRNFIDDTTNTIIVDKKNYGTSGTFSLTFDLENAIWDHDQIPTHDMPLSYNAEIPSDYFDVTITDYNQEYYRQRAWISFKFNYDNIKKDYDVLSNSLTIDLAPFVKPTGEECVLPSDGLKITFTFSVVDSTT